MGELKVPVSWTLEEEIDLVSLKTKSVLLTLPLSELNRNVITVFIILLNSLNDAGFTI